jgi:iron(III) transport system substrate-binding protein
MGEVRKPEGARPFDALLARRELLRLAALGGGAALLGACQAPAPGAAPAPATSTAVATGSAPAPSAPTAGGDWEKRWNDLIEAARREGSVVLSGPPTPAVRTDVTARFKERFGIDVEYLGGRRGDLVVRLQSERAAGLYTVDVVIGGAQTIAVEFYPAKMIAPIRPALIHPEATDPAKWRPGRLWFIDPDDAYVLRLVNNVSPMLGYNTTKVAPDEIKTAQDLLNPRYRGLIAQDDPTVSGTGSNTAAYIRSRLGDDFIRRLYADQQVQFTRDRRQLSDWLGRATYPIVINPNEADVLGPLVRDGFPIRIAAGLPDLPANVTAGSGLTILLDPAPHPNAARLLVNWLAMREGNEVYARAEGAVPLRADVDPVWAPEYQIPKPGVEYFDTYDWDFTLADKATVSERIKAWRGG